MCEMAKREKGWTKEVKKRVKESDGLMGKEESDFKILTVHRSERKRRKSAEERWRESLMISNREERVMVSKRERYGNACLVFRE